MNQVRVWGRKTGSLMLVLLYMGCATARELSVYSGVSSNHVYPLLRYWIEKGVVKVVKLASTLNMYSLDDRVRRAVRRALELYARVRPYELLKVYLFRLVESKLYRRLKPAEKVLLAMLLERMLSTSSDYIRIACSSAADGYTKLAEMVRRRLKAQGIDSKKLSQELYSLTDYINELAEHGIIFRAFYREENTFVLKLDNNIVKAFKPLISRVEFSGERR